MANCHPSWFVVGLHNDESTTNIGLFTAGTGPILKHADQPLLTLVGLTRASRPHPAPARGASSARESGKLRHHPGPEARAPRGSTSRHRQVITPPRARTGVVLKRTCAYQHASSDCQVHRWRT